jgi:hypothetical protein
MAVNERNAGRKSKFSVPSKSKTFRIPVECEAEITEAINKITKKYLIKKATKKQ